MGDPPFRSNSALLGACTNQAEEPGNQGKCGWNQTGDDSHCWQSVVVVDDEPAPAPKQALHRWLCDSSCQDCGFSELVDVDTCVTTATPMGTPTDDRWMKMVNCADGVVTLTSFGKDGKGCNGDGAQDTKNVGECTPLVWPPGAYEIWAPTAACSSGVIV